MTEYDRKFVEGSSATYRKAIRLLEQSWSKTSGESLHVDTSLNPASAFADALKKLEDGIKAFDQKRQNALWGDLEETLAEEPAAKELVDETRKVPVSERSDFLERDIDHVSPRTIFTTMREVALAELGDEDEVETTLRDYLRAVMKEVSDEMAWNPPLRVGENRHFSRLWQWFSEYSETTATEDSYGIRAINTRGPVPNWPLGPGVLRVRIIREYLP